MNEIAGLFNKLLTSPTLFYGRKTWGLTDKDGCNLMKFYSF
jgi:hypothetical protein